jgi:hypothetical protein
MNRANTCATTLRPPNRLPLSASGISVFQHFSVSAFGLVIGLSRRSQAKADQLLI